MEKTPLRERIRQLHHAQRRRLERLEDRYAQLDLALEAAESLLPQLPSEDEELSHAGRPKKPK